MKFLSIIAVVVVVQTHYCRGIYLTNDSAKISTENEDPTSWTEGIWGPVLEDWVLSSKREKRVMMHQIGSEDAITVVDRSTIDEEQDERESKIHNSKIVNTNNFPGNIPSKGKPPKQVSETDLYLLSAIEKLVYKVDFMEKRLRRVEEMLYYAMAGNRIDQDPCPNNFTRIGENCYMFGSAAGREYDWKVASKQCRQLNAVLAEFETIEENQDIVMHIQASSYLRGKDFWTGGLNPGLLWIWSNSARPVSTSNKNPNQNNQSTNIIGDGRCLRLAYNPGLRSYAYKGSDCSIRYSYICEIPENSSSNEISRIGKSRNIFREL